MTQIIEKSKKQGVDTLARIGGATFGKVLTSLTGASGLVPSLILLIGGFAVTIQAPDKYKLKEMGEGLALFGGMKVLGELTNDKINIFTMQGGVAGLGNTSTEISNFIPESIRSFINSYLPTIDGVNGIGSIPAITQLDNGARALPAPAPVNGLNGIPVISSTPIGMVA